MLNIHFINVADGDSILIEDWEGERVFRMMVDTGRRELACEPDSRRCRAIDYLREKQITHLDVLVVTHLHTDHAGGLGTLVPEITIDDVYSGFFPGGPGERAPLEPDGQKTVRGLIECLNQWAEDVDRLRDTAARLHTVSGTLRGLSLTPRLSADIICPNRTENAVQRLVWEDMLRGLSVPEDLKYWASKSRNPGSLRLRLTYAGRTIELAGDCYGCVWEDEALEPCDILKVPHHGDAKAMTEKLAEKLHPSWAVISCKSEYVPHKDRPSQGAVELLRRTGARVLFTDSFSAPWHQADYWNSVDFTILEDGTVLAPESRDGNGR